MKQKGIATTAIVAIVVVAAVAIGAGVYVATSGGDEAGEGGGGAGAYLWLADSGTDKIYKLDTSGNVISSFDSPGMWTAGLAWGGVSS